LLDNLLGNSLETLLSTLAKQIRNKL
jgi:hypothetical protein